MNPSSASAEPSRRVPLRLLALALLGLLALGAAAALKQVVGSRGEAALEAPPAAGSVTVLGRQVVVLRAPMFGYTPQERARSVEARIQALVDAGRVGAVTVSDAPQGGGKIVKIGDRVAFAIVPEDLDTIAGETLEGVSQLAAGSLTQALEDEAESRNLSSLLLNGLWVLLATVLYVGLLVLLGHGVRWMRGGMGALAERHATRLAGLGFRGLPQALVGGAGWLLRVLFWILVVVTTYGWLAFALSRFPWTRAIGETLAGFVLGVLETVAVSLASWVPGLVFVAVIFTATHYVNRGVKLFFDAVESGSVRMPQAFVETAQPTRRLVTICVWIFGLVEAYPHLPGSGTDAFKGISVFVGLVVSLGGTGVVGHATSGMVLMFSRALKPGDYIRVGEHEGTVISLGMLSTKVRTPWLEEVNIPNQLLAGSTMMNYSRAARGTGVVLHTSVTIGYDAPWRQVHAMLLAAAGRTAGLDTVPAPYVLQRALSDFYVEYELCAYLSRPHERVKVLAELHGHIQDAFNEQGVQIMSPHYFGDPAHPKIVPPERWSPGPGRAERSEPR